MADRGQIRDGAGVADDEHRAFLDPCRQRRQRVRGTNG
jgi:hypothetical protein